MSKKSCTVIYNPITSGFKLKNLDKVCLVLDKCYDVEPKKSEYSGHAEELTKYANQTSDLVISFGGDGTFGELISGIYNESQKALISHIPIGTANDLKRNFGLSKDPEKSAELIMTGQEQKLDIFTINGIPFSYVSAFGYFANVPCNTSPDLKKRLKYLAYLAVGVDEYRRKKPITYDMTVESESKLFDEKAIVSTFTNSTGFGGMSLFSDATLDDGKFEVTFVREMSKLDMLKIAKDIISGKFNLNNYPEFINHFKAELLNIKFNDVMPEDPIDLDGDAKNVFDNQNILRLRRGKVIKMQLPKR